MATRHAYIVDDEQMLRSMVRQALVGLCTDIDEFDSAEAFLDGHHHRPLGCIIVDICLPGIDGLDLLEMLARGGSPHPVIVMSANGTVPHAIRAGRLGVVDFIEKPFRVADPLEAMQKGFELLRTRELSPVRSLETLTPREKEVLVRFAEGGSNKIVAYNLGISARTVELHRANLLRKLGVRSLSQALLLAKDGGYV
jgi:two-component system, LuxR family, response regulator FixJ